VQIRPRAPLSPHVQVCLENMSFDKRDLPHVTYSETIVKGLSRRYSDDKFGHILPIQFNLAVGGSHRYLRPMIEQSTITCPKCGHAATEQMPTDACQFFYDCKGCGERLKPLPGDCCVFCSYGSVPCPPIQAGDCCQ
jgi:hypothetical protein